MPNFAKKCKKQFRRILYSKIFSCVCTKGEVKNEPESLPSSDPSETLDSQKLEILLLKTLKNQLEEREYHDQLKHTLSQISTILEQFGKNYELHQKLSQRFPNDGFSKFTITVSKDSLIHCQTDARKKSLVVLNERNVNGGNKESSVVLHKCENDIWNGRIIPKGGFSAILYKNDKEVQYDPKLSVASFQTSSKLIQTQLLNFSNFNIVPFKINLVKHIRNLKQDVITLRQLLNSLDQYPQAGCSLNTREVSIFSPTKGFLREQEAEFKFFEAKTRAANFVTFYKLRKSGDKRKNKGRDGGKNKK